MYEFKKKQLFRKRLYSLPVLILLAGATLLVMHATWNIYQKAQLSKQKMHRAQEEQNTLEAKKASIEQKIARMETETGIEEEIRSKFDVAREGEQVIVIVEPKEATSTPEQQPSALRSFFNTIFPWMQ